MRTAKWFTLALAAAITGGLFTLPLHAAESAKPARPLAGKWRERVKEQLGLTDDQVAQIREQLKGEKETIVPMLKRLHEARGGLHDEINKPGATDASVRDAATKLAAVESDLAVERMKIHGKINPLLTAEQREKLAGMRQKAEKFMNRAAKRAHDRSGD